MAGDRYNDPDFIGLLTVNLSLIFAKEGLEQFSEDEVKTFCNNIKRSIQSSSAPIVPGPHTCVDSTKSRLHNKKKLTQEWEAGTFSCQADHCDQWLGEISKAYVGSAKSVEWDNSDLTQLSTDPWACAKLFMPYGCEKHKGATDADLQALLTLFIKCTHFHGFFNDVDDCKKIKDIRNSTMHSATLKADASTVTASTQVIIQFLEDLQNIQQPLHQQACKDAVLKIKELVSGKTEISLNREYELRVLNEKLESLVNEVDALSEQVQDLSNTTADAAELNMLKAQHQTLTSDLALVRTQSEDFSQFIADNKINGVNTEKLSEVSSKIAKLETELKQLTSRVEHLEEQMKDICKEQTELKQHHGDLEHDLRELKQGHGELKQVHGDLKQDHGKLKQDHGQLKQDHEQLKHVQGEMKNTLEVVKEGQKQAYNKQGEFEKNQEQLAKEHGELKQKQEETKATLEEVSKGHRQLDKNQEEVKKNQEELSKEQTGIKKNQEEISKAQAEMKQEHGELKKGHEELKKGHELRSVLVENEEATSHQSYKMEGYMEKLPLNKKKATWRNKWNKRFFVVQGGLLHYYKKSNKYRPKKSLQLMGGHIEELGQRVIGIKDGSGSYLMVRVASENEYSQWIAALKSQTYQIQGNQVIKEISVADIQHHLISFYTKRAQKIPIYPLRPEWKQQVTSLFVLPSMKLTNPRGSSKHHLMMGVDERSDSVVTRLQDIFVSAGSRYTDIYIMGDAGTGKSTLCEYLVHLWVSCHTSSNHDPDSEENFMEQFKFLFYVSLRDAKSTIVEEIIKSQLQLEEVNVARLHYDHSSLIILDGLDEYSLEKTSRTRFGSENLPSRRHSDKCTVLTTSRPWKIELLRRELEDKIDRQISIVGLDTTSQKKLVGKVVDLLNSDSNDKKTPKDFIMAIQTQKLNKFMKTPVLLMQMVGLWFSGEPLGHSQCSIYAKLIDKQIQFTEEIRNVPPNISTQVQHIDERNIQGQFYMYFKNYTFIMKYKDLLQKVAKFAHCTLSSKDKENSLVFSHEQMELFDMSPDEILLCLELGLLTQYKVFGEITQRLKSISFIHKTHQEFFASIHLSQIDQADELIQLLNRDFTSLEQVLEMGTVFMFVCGMNPTVARDISRFIMDKVSGDARLEQYRQVGDSWYSTDPNTALVKQVQGLILAGIEEGTQNNHKITGMQLQDLDMDVTDDDFPPARVLACTESLNLSHVKSLYIRDEGAISGDVLQQLLKETSPSLHKLVLWDTVVSVEMIQAVVQQQQGRLQTLGLINVKFDNVDFSHLNQTDLQTILSAPTHSLSLYGIVLTHSQLEFLCHHVSNSCYGEVFLGWLQCTIHGYKGTECKQHLDLSASRNLSWLFLYQLPVQEVTFVPDNLVLCGIQDLPEPVSTSIIRCLKRAEKLERLCGGLRGSTVAELAATLPHLQHLQVIVLSDINLSGQQQVVQAVAQLKKLEGIELWGVTMREEELRELLAALPSSHRVDVSLGDGSEHPVTITGYNRNTDLIGQIRHNTQIHVTHDEVEITGDTCTVKKFWFQTDN